MKGLDTVESLSAGAARDPNRNMGTIIIIYIFVTLAHSNIDFHKLGLFCTNLGKIFLIL